LLPKSVINRLLSEKYGPDVTFHKCLRRIRIHFAAGLPAVSDLPVCGVALESGFNSVHTFIRLFKAEYGETSSQYRGRNKTDCT
jgi:transcriptional regulator GlxA family with amidase domain